MRDLSVDWVRRVLSYNPDTGVLTWIVTRRGHPAGTRAGNVSRSKGKGYRYIKIAKKRIKASHLAWVIMTGSWPSLSIDHRNRVRDDDRWENLRPASCAEQRRNAISAKSKSGIRGVRRHKNRWRAEIRINGRQTHIGNFATIEAARDAYIAAARKHHGEFFNETLMEAR